MKKIFSIFFLLLILSPVSLALDITKDYSAQDLNTIIDVLGESYDSITVETLGESYLNNPIKALQLKSRTTEYDEEKRYTKGIYHFLVVGGIHGRERINPKLLIKQIEYYAKNELLPNNMIIHYIPLINPDGYDLSLLEGLTTEYLETIDDKNYPRWKANIRGVDLNRNFPDTYLDLDSMTWINRWGAVDYKRYKTEEPSGEYYFGPYAGSEIETQLLMDYMNRYKFEMFLDYHSQGEVLYVDKWFMSKIYNKKSLILADRIMALNDYRIPRGDGEYSSGFTSNYMANRHRVPSITIETTRTRNLPYLADSDEINAYKENRDVTLEVLKKAIEQKEFGSFKAYDTSGHFFDDYSDEKIAMAYARRYNLEIKEYSGIPIEHLDDFVNEWAVQSITKLVSLSILNIDLSEGYQSDISVKDFLDSLERINEERYLKYEKPDIVRMISNHQKMNRVQTSYILYTYLDGDQYDIETVYFEDTDNLLEKYKEAVYFVNKTGLINGYPENKFKPMNILTKEEAAIILLRLFQLDRKGAFKNE